jgi:hypothetical protein
MQISALELADANGLRGRRGAARRKPTGYLLQLVVLQLVRNGLLRILFDFGFFASGLLGHAILVCPIERNARGSQLEVHSKATHFSGLKPISQ